MPITSFKKMFLTLIYFVTFEPFVLFFFPMNCIDLFFLRVIFTEVESGHPVTCMLSMRYDLGAVICDRSNTIPFLFGHFTAE